MIFDHITVLSPGRINLIGEHIDYSGGHVLPAAIDLSIQFEFKKIDGSIAKISSKEAGSFEIDLSNDLVAVDTSWHNYFIGVIYGLQQLTQKTIGGFECSFSSTIPTGAGISSSAALESGIAKGLNELFELGLSDLDLINICQRAEHDFVGTPCGIMDQFTVIKAKANTLLLLNCNTLVYQEINADFKDYEVVLLNTNVTHELSTSEYHIRARECNEALAIVQSVYPAYEQLCDIPLYVIDALKPELDQKSPKLYQRATYAVEENNRTLKAAELIQKGKVEEFGALVYESHQGLSIKYEVSCEELDFLVDFSKSFYQVVGARMMGGGFGGCTINVVHTTFVDKYIKLASIAYQNQFDTELTPIRVKLSKGTHILSHY